MTLANDTVSIVSRNKYTFNGKYELKQGYKFMNIIALDSVNHFLGA